MFKIALGNQWVYLAILMDFASMVYEQLGKLVEITTYSVLKHEAFSGKVKLTQYGNNRVPLLG